MINTEGAGKLRTQLTRSVVLALRELMRQTQPDDHSRDLAAYISIALGEIYQTAEESVAAWEKKGYWVKADRFRMDWEWADRLAVTMRKALVQEDWATVAMTAAQIAQKLMSVDVPQRHKLGEPWQGAWKQLQKNLAQQ
ncbi:MAG TPA: hypothetical protein VIO36_04680 [Anaerolineaceae bacterium]